MDKKLGFWLLHLGVIAVCAVLIGAFGVQFIKGEFPCPLCILQRMAMILAAMGPAYIIFRSRFGDVISNDYAVGCGMGIIASVAGLAMSARQVMLHICPICPDGQRDSGYGSPILGLHLYSWGVIIFLVIIVVCGLSLMFINELTPTDVQFGPPSQIVLLLFGLLIVMNLIIALFETGFHLYLADNPDRYQLLYDLRIKK